MVREKIDSKKEYSRPKESPQKVDVIKKYKPKFIGRGGEHLVYEIPEHPGVVVKVLFGSIESIMTWNLERGNPPNDFGDELKELARKKLKEVRAEHRAFRKHFGDEHTVPRRIYIMNVPVAEEELKEIVDNNPPIPGSSNVWSVATIENKYAFDDNDFGISFYHDIKKGSFKEGKYVDEMVKLLTGANEDTTNEKMTEIFPANKISLIIGKIEKDNEFKREFKNLIEKSIDYINEKRKILDFIGENNVFFQKNKNGKGWNFMAVDLLGFNKPTVEVVKNAVSDYLENESKYEQANFQRFHSELINVSMLNCFAGLLSIEDRVKVLPEDINDEEIRKLIQLILQKLDG